LISERRGNEMLTEGDLSYAGISVVTVLSAGIGAFIGAYLKKKGENFATHEDLNKMVEQMAAITERTKSIEAKISSEVWDKQKHWEMKREVLFEAAKRVAEIHDALANFGSARKLAQELGGEKMEKILADVTERWVKASAAMDETLLFLSVACEQETIDVCNAFQKIATNIATGIAKSEPNAFAEGKIVFHVSLSATQNAIRRELGIRPLPTPSSVCA
jgi:hypothetical protein